MSSPWIAPALQKQLDELTEAQVFIATLYGEVRSEPVEGIVAVAAVVRNRVNDGRWGKDYRRACLAPWQFSCWNPVGGVRNHDKVAALVKQMSERMSVTDPQVRELAYLAHGFLGGFLRDPVSGATHYHVATMQPRPKWARDQVPVAQKGHHVFYAGIR